MNGSYKGRLNTERLAEAKWFREQIASLFGYGAQELLARLMVDLGDDRDACAVARSIRRMASGGHRISGEMRVLIGLLNRAAQMQDSSLPINQPIYANCLVNSGLANARSGRRHQRRDIDQTVNFYRDH